MERKTLTLVGRSDTDGMNLDEVWDFNATIVFEP